MLSRDFFCLIFADLFHPQQYTLSAHLWVAQEGQLMRQLAAFSPSGEDNKPFLQGACNPAGTH